MPLTLKAAQYEPKTPNEHVEGLCVILPLENRIGYVFTLVALPKKHPDNEALMYLVSDHIHRLASSFGKDANAQHRFEQFLGSLNETLSQVVREGRCAIPIQSLHAAVGIICEDRMFFSGTGELSALFLHRKPSQRYQIFNLFRGIQTEQSLPTWEKPFAVVLDGTLEEGDVFCLCQKDLQHKMAQDDLNAILTTLPPKSATEKIRQEFGANDGLLLLVMKAETSQTSVSESYAKPLSDVSVDSLVRTQDETTKLLEDQKPDVFGFLTFHVKTFFGRFTDRSRLLKDLRRGESNTKMIVRVAGQTMQMLARALKRTIRHAGTLVRILREPSARKDLFPRARVCLRTWGLKQAQHLRSLPARQKQTGLIVIVLCIILITGVLGLARAHKTSEERKTLARNVGAIQEILDRANGALIYKDENQARDLYAQARARIDALPKNNTASQNAATKLSEDVETAQNSLRHVIAVQSPVAVATLDSGSGSQIGVRIVLSGKNLFITDTTQHLWRADILSKQTSLLSQNPISTSSLLDLSEEDGHLIAADQNKTVWRIDTTTGEGTLAPLGDASGLSMQSVIAYANRLYVLSPSSDKTDAQILKLPQDGNGYGAPVPWIRSKTQALANAVSFAIDGTMYILSSNGRVVRFQNGAEVGWQLGVVDPALVNPTRIWTNPDINFIYVLEPQAKRLLSFQKDTGNFVTQYVSDSIATSTDFTIDPKTKTAYILSGSTVFTFPL